jgi:serpin B
MPRPGFRTGALVVMSCALLSAIAGCRWWLADVEDPAGFVFVASDLPRETNPQVAGEQVSDLVRANGEFAFDLLAELSSGSGNVFFSPYSISSALAMAYAGARGSTETQMGEVLRFDAMDQGVHAIFNWLDLELGERDQVSPPSEGNGFELRVANAVWAQEGHGFLQDYLDTLAVDYGAGLRLVDFVGDPDGARTTIDDWISEETEGKVVDLVPPTAIDVDTRMVLTDAIYFRSPWLKPFDEAETRDERFTTLAGASVTVRMMRQVETFSYARFDLGQAVELPYNGAQIAMVVFVPDAGMYETFEADLDFARYGEIVDALWERKVDLGMPEFGFSYEVALPYQLRELGMTDAFVPGAADLSGMDGTHELFISDVLHKAFVAVTEAGTEAAAATAVVVSPTMTEEPPVALSIDRPFTFVIRDVPTGTILFVGRVVSLF